MKIQIKRVSQKHHKDIIQSVKTIIKREVVITPNKQETKLQIDKAIEFAEIDTLYSIQDAIRIRITKPFTEEKETLIIGYDCFKEHGLEMVETIIRDFIMTIGTLSYGRDIVKWGAVGMKKRTKYDIWLENGTL